MLLSKDIIELITSNIELFKKIFQDNKITTKNDLQNFLPYCNKYINEFKPILLQHYNIIDMLYENIYNHTKITLYYENGLYYIEDYEWSDEEILKEFIILLLCYYYENYLFKIS